MNFGNKPSYSIKIAEKNLRALAACSQMLIQALTNVLFEVPREKRTYLKVLTIFSLLHVIKMIKS